MRLHRLGAAGLIGFQTCLLMLAGERVLAALILAGLVFGLWGVRVNLPRAWYWPVRGAMLIGLAALWWLVARQPGEREVWVAWVRPAAAGLISLQALELVAPDIGKWSGRTIE